jgi:hypothetical protein
MSQGNFATNFPTNVKSDPKDVRNAKSQLRTGTGAKRKCSNRYSITLSARPSSASGALTPSTAARAWR